MREFTTTEILERLNALKICQECNISGKSCDDGCKYGYVNTNKDVLDLYKYLHHYFTVKAIKDEIF